MYRHPTDSAPRFVQKWPSLGYGRGQLGFGDIPAVRLSQEILVGDWTLWADSEMRLWVSRGHVDGLRHPRVLGKAHYVGWTDSISLRGIPREDIPERPGEHVALRDGRGYYPRVLCWCETGLDDCEHCHGDMYIDNPEA